MEEHDSPRMADLSCCRDPAQDLAGWLSRSRRRAPGAPGNVRAFTQLERPCRGSGPSTRCRSNTAGGHRGRVPARWREASRRSPCFGWRKGHPPPAAALAAGHSGPSRGEGLKACLGSCSLGKHHKEQLPRHAFHPSPREGPECPAARQPGRRRVPFLQPKQGLHREACRHRAGTRPPMAAGGIGAAPGGRTTSPDHGRSRARVKHEALPRPGARPATHESQPARSWAGSRQCARSAMRGESCSSMTPGRTRCHREHALPPAIWGTPV